MTKVNIFEENGKITKIIINGHSGYAISGKDIVCSSISSIVITSINGIISINEDYLSVLEEDGKMTIEILSNDQICEKLIDNMLSLLKELSSNYPKNIIVK